ncbi:putative mitochondrial protein, partial [Mucuna pruriens]
MHPEYEHVRDQILSSEHIPSMNSLVTRLLRVPTIMKGDGIVVENSTMVASRGRGRSGQGTRGILRNGKGGHDIWGPSRSSLETHNQDILQPSSFVHPQAELSPPSMSTCQSRTQEMGTPICEYSLDSCPLSSTDPTPDPLPSSPSHDSNIALDHPGWRHSMIVEMQALEQSDTWELVSLPSSKKVVSCRWVFAIKVVPNDTIDRLKGQLVVKGYTQVYGLDYGDTFSPVAKITTIRLLLAMVAIRH